MKLLLLAALLFPASAADKPKTGQNLAAVVAGLDKAITDRQKVGGPQIAAVMAAAGAQAVAQEPKFAFGYWAVSFGRGCDHHRTGDATAACRAAIQDVTRAIALDPTVPLFYTARSEYDLKLNGNKAVSQAAKADCVKAYRLTPAWDAPGLQPCFSRLSELPEAQEVNKRSIAMYQKGTSVDLYVRERRYLQSSAAAFRRRYKLK